MSLRSYFFAPTVLFLMMVLPTTEQNTTADDSDDLFFVDQRLKVEFIENLSKQTYIDQISYDDRYVLDLYLFDQNMKNANFQLDGEFLRMCPRSIFKSIGLTGVSNPVLRTSNIEICPNMKANCCTNNDLVGLEAIWHDYSAFIEINYDYFAYYAKTTIRAMPIIESRAEALRNVSKHMICREMSETFLTFKSGDLKLDVFLKQLQGVKKYDLSLKKGFKCLLCDFNNNKYIDLLNRVVIYKTDFCVDIVKNTLPFFINMRDFFLRYFNSVTMIARCSKHHGQDFIKTFPFDYEEEFDFLNVRNSYYDNDCLKAYLSKKDDQIAIYCRNYCHKFDLWGYEGILPNSAKMGSMFKLIQENLLDPLQIEVIRPSEDLGVYKFPFSSELDDVFSNFDQMFGAQGIEPVNVKEFQ